MGWERAPKPLKRRFSCLVTGGGGFLGRHLVERLLELGHAVRIFDIRKTFEDDRVEFFIGDLRKRSDVSKALEGIDTIFHCASPTAIQVNKELFFGVNVDGTRNIVECAEAAGVERVVMTSSASVVYTGADIENGTEKLPYPPESSRMDYYTHTKTLAEEIVLKANGRGKLRTCAIRPHGIFGPRDVQMAPTVLKNARAGKMKYIIGNGENIVDFTYVLNVVHAHVLGAEKLAENAPGVAGNAFNISNDEPVKFWEFMGDFISRLGYDRPHIKLPFTLVYVIACIVELVTFVLSPFVRLNPTFTRLKVTLAGTHHYYSCEKAKKYLGYTPVFSLYEGIALTTDAFRHLARDADGKKER